MFAKKVTVANETGLHARPASMVTKFCKQYKEQEIRLVGNGKETDPKSIIQLLSAGLVKGTEIEVQVTGDNEEAICSEIVSYIESLTD